MLFRQHCHLEIAVADVRSSSMDVTSVVCLCAGRNGMRGTSRILHLRKNSVTFTLLGTIQVLSTDNVHMPYGIPVWLN